MKHEFRYDDEHQLLVIVLIENILYSDMDPFFGNVDRLLEGKPYRQVLCDITKPSGFENREAREETSRRLIKSNISEIAFVGANAANRMLAKVLLKTGIIKTKGDFFKRQDDAINWLKKRR